MEQLESQNLLLSSLSKYYSIPSNIDKLATIIDNTSSLSLRLIDWYVTNYCKNNNVVYILPGKRYFNVYLNYRAQLKAFKKIQFDPFRRRERITFCMPSSSSYKKKTHQYHNRSIEFLSLGNRKQCRIKYREKSRRIGT